MEWISVKDRLPETTGLYLVFTPELEQKCSFTRTLWYISDKGWGSGWERTSAEVWAEKITHWMPLPEPPEKKDRWTYKQEGRGFYLLVDPNDYGRAAHAVCDALNGTARELLEFAGIEEEDCDCGCEDGKAYPPFHYQTYHHDPSYYQITNDHGVPFPLADIVALLNDRKCICGYHK